jgi:hypothetical protein
VVEFSRITWEMAKIKEFPAQCVQNKKNKRISGK